MMLNYLRESHQRTQAKIQDFYTSTGIHVYIKDPLVNENIDIEKVINRVEEIIPIHLLEEVEMVIIGWFDEFEKRSVNAFYKDGALYVSNIQDNEEDIFDDIVHEIAHSLEQLYGYDIYGDKQLEKEFLRKRKYLHDILWKHGYKAPLSYFMDPEYNEEFDAFLLKKVGYGKLSSLIAGIFLSAYAPTSLKEYYATGFTEFYLDPNHNFLKKTSPALYKKIFMLQREEKS
jgi:hypothetical protein